MTCNLLLIMLWNTCMWIYTSVKLLKTRHTMFHWLLPLAVILEQRENIVIFMVKKKKLNRTVLSVESSVISILWSATVIPDDYFVRFLSFSIQIFLCFHPLKVVMQLLGMKSSFTYAFWLKYLPEIRTETNINPAPVLKIFPFWWSRQTITWLIDK